MTQSGPWDSDRQPTDPGAGPGAGLPPVDHSPDTAPNPIAPQSFSGGYPPSPQLPPQFPPQFPPPPPPTKNRAGLMIVAVIAAIAVLTAIAVVVIRQTHTGSVSTAESSTAASSSPTSPVPANQLQSVHIAAPNVITKPDSSEPLVTLTVYEDFLCPYCGLFEKTYGSSISKMIDAGQIAVDYTMVSILGRHNKSSYSVRSGAMAYCVADVDKGAFRRFHAALFAQQPDESANTFPTDDQLLDQARQAGATGSVPDCVHSGKYLTMVNNAVENSKIEGTPTINLNGQDVSDDLMNKFDPQTLIDKVNAITGNKH
jgi:protein-disulfide isomerase